MKFLVEIQKKIYIPVLPTPALQWISQGPVFGLSRSFLPYCEARARTTSINCSKTEAYKFEKNNENKYIFLFSELMPIRVKTFWEGHKKMKKSPTLFWRYSVIFQNKVGDFFKLSGLLTISILCISYIFWSTSIWPWSTLNMHNTACNFISGDIKFPHQIIRSILAIVQLNRNIVKSSGVTN